MFDRRNGLVPIAQNRLSSAFGCVAIDVRAPFGVVHHVIHTTPGGTDSGLQLGFPNVTFVHYMYSKMIDDPPDVF